MADSTTTGSTIVGTINGGLQKGLTGGVSDPTMSTKILSVYGNPNTVVTSNIGSQLAYDVENFDIYMSTTAAGSEWNRLGSLT